MSLSVCLSPDCLGYPEGGGHLWVYLNWALGLRACGCQVIWLEGFDPGAPADATRANIAALKRHLAPYGLANCLALCSRTGEPLPVWVAETCLNLEDAAECDLLLNMRYDTRAEVVGRFRRSALLDIDPGLLQIWMISREIEVAPHHLYLTTGETVGSPDAHLPDAGVKWEYTPPCVALDHWSAHRAEPDAAFTTVSHWYADEWLRDGDEVYANDKRSGFLPYLDLPQYTAVPLELALCLGADEEEELAELQRRGWRVRHAHSVSAAPWDYQRYIRGSLGEFSCCKPAYVRLQTAWVSDRTLCYLASGKPAVVEYTGASRFLPHAAGLFRFRGVKEAERCLDAVMADYERQCLLARALAEEYFDARKVVTRVLEKVLA